MTSGEKYRQQKRLYRLANKDKIAEYESRRNELRRNDPATRAQKAMRDKRWRDNNLARKREINRLWRKANPAKVAAQQKRHREKHPNRVMGRRVKYAETKNFGWIDVRLIDNYYTKICGICGLLITGKFEVDHIIPLSRNGTHSLDNMQLAHPVCNRTKSGHLQSEKVLDIMILREYTQ